MTAGLRLVISGYGGWSLAAILTALGLLLAWERYETARLCEALRERHRIDEERIAILEQAIALQGRGTAVRRPWSCCRPVLMRCEKGTECDE